jgi:hypothetical protein
MTEKPTNPKDMIGVRKTSMSAVPSGPLQELSLAMLEGALKYGRHNYRKAGVRSSIYYDAAMRHLMAWWEGEDVDPDSGISHLVKAIACLVVVRDSELHGNINDDRPEPMKPGWITLLNDKAGEIIERYGSK